MRDEARLTASHQSWTSGDARLRQRPVAFVSAGVVEPLKEEKPPNEPADPNMVVGPTEEAIESVSDVLGVEDVENASTEIIDVIKVETTFETIQQEASVTEFPVQERCAGDSDQPSEAQENETNELFFFDLGEDQPMIDSSVPFPKISSPRSSFGGSDSSEEVILFKGRTVSAGGVAQSNNLCRPSVTGAHSVGPAERKPEASVAASSKPDPQSATPPPQPSRKRARSRRGRLQAPIATEDDDEDAILADYIANMAANSDNDLTVSQNPPFSGHRDLGGDHHAVNLGSTNEKSPQDDASLGDEGEGSIESGTSNSEGDALDQEMDSDMDDETLARLFAKQEELGIDGDDLLLLTTSFAQTGSKKSLGKRPTKVGTSRGWNATQVADAFDSLDLADWSQLTGQSRKRRSKQPPNFNLSDSELEAAMKKSWQRDRERKKNRKLEREALRAEGLLDKNASPDDLRVKYHSGMKLDEIKTELTSFLLSSAERWVTFDFLAATHRADYLQPRLSPA